MPYKTISEAKEAKFSTTLDGAKLTLSQINYISRIYDRVKNNEKVKNPMGIAYQMFRQKYIKKGQNWKKRNG